MAGMSGFNSVEITEIAVRWVGLYHATVVAHPRHLHQTPFLQDPVSHYYPHDIQDIAEIFWRAAEVEPQVKGI